MYYLEDMVESLGFLPAEMKKKCSELRELDLQYQAKMEKLGSDLTQFFTTLPKLTKTEFEKQNKEFEQRYYETRLIANSKIHITEYLQSVLEKYNEKVAKDLTDFRAELEIENPGEVDLIEKSFIQSINNPCNNLFYSENSSELDEQSVSPSGVTTTTTTGHLNGTDVMDITPKNATIQKIKRQTSTYEDFKIPSTFRRPAQSVDVKGSKTTINTTVGRLIDDDIFDTEMAAFPPVKKHKISAPSLRQIVASTTNEASTSLVASSKTREYSPRSSISSISPRSTSPSTSSILPHSLSKFQFPPSRMASIERWNASMKQSTSTNIINEQLIPPTTLNNLQQQQQHSAALLRMPSFAGAQPSRHGRTRKLTKRVVQMLSESMPKPPEQHGTSSSSTIIRHQHNERIATRRQRRIVGGGKDDNNNNNNNRNIRGIVEGENIIEEEDEEHLDDYDEGEEIFDDEEGEEEEEEEADDKAWCYCKQGSAGNMVACDSKNCPYEWFHYECVGITQPPKGRWYCPTCSMKLSSAMRSRSASSEQQR